MENVPKKEVLDTIQHLRDIAFNLHCEAQSPREEMAWAGICFEVENLHKLVEQLPTADGEQPTAEGRQPAKVDCTTCIHCFVFTDLDGKGIRCCRAPRVEEIIKTSLLDPRTRYQYPMCHTVNPDGSCLWWQKTQGL